MIAGDRHAQQQAMTNIVLPVKTVLQYHDGVAVAFIQADITAVPPNKTGLVKQRLTIGGIAEPAQGRGIVITLEAAKCHGIGKCVIQLGVTGAGEMRLQITQQIVSC